VPHGSVGATQHRPLMGLHCPKQHADDASPPPAAATSPEAALIVPTTPPMHTVASGGQHTLFDGPVQLKPAWQ
jgi:hypothetical protein